MTVKEKLFISLKRILGFITGLILVLNLGIIWCYFVPKFLWCDLFKLQGGALEIAWFFTIFFGTIGFGWLIYGILYWLNWLFNDKLSDFYEDMEDWFFEFIIRR